MRAITNATVHTATDRGTVPDGTVLIEDGEITTVGGDVDVPGDADVDDAGGDPVTPGLVDAHSHAGMAEWVRPGTATSTS